MRSWWCVWIKHFVTSSSFYLPITSFSLTHFIKHFPPLVLSLARWRWTRCHRFLFLKCYVSPIQSVTVTCSSTSLLSAAIPSGAAVDWRRRFSVGALLKLFFNLIIIISILLLLLLRRQLPLPNLRSGFFIRCYFCTTNFLLPRGFRNWWYFISQLFKNLLNS